MVVYAGLFESEDMAREALKALSEIGLKPEDFFMISPAEGSAKLKEVLAASRNTEFRGMTNRMQTALEEGRSLVGARPQLSFGPSVDVTLEEAGAAKVIMHSDSELRFFSQVFGLSSLIIRGRPRVTIFRKPLTETLGKTMLYKRPVTETLGKKMLLASKPITESWLGKKMLYPSKPITESWLGKRMLFESRPITESWLGKKMLLKSKPITERLGKPMIISEINERD